MIDFSIRSTHTSKEKYESDHLSSLAKTPRAGQLNRCWIGTIQSLIIKKNVFNEQGKVKIH